MRTTKHHVCTTVHSQYRRYHIQCRAVHRATQTHTHIQQHDSRHIDTKHTHVHAMLSCNMQNEGFQRYNFRARICLAGVLFHLYFGILERIAIRESIMRK